MSLTDTNATDSDVRSEVEIEIKSEAKPETPRTKSARKPVKKMQRSSTFDLKYFHGNTLSFRRGKNNVDVDAIPFESSQKAALTNRKNREQQLNLFHEDSEMEKHLEGQIPLQQRREGFNLITGEAYNDRPVSALSVRTSANFLVQHTPR